MAKFVYKALAADGTLTEGNLDASGRQEALRQLQLKGLRPIKLSEGAGAATARKAAESGGGFSLGFGRKKLSARQLEDFMRQLSSLLSSGVPLARALQILAREGSTPASKEIWKSIHDQVIDGVPLADAMARHPDSFPRIYTAMVQAGETGGFLDLVLNQIADFQARDKELRGKVKAAMVYPAVLMLLAVGVVIFLLTFFIPRFQKLFDQFGGNLPALTEFIVAASEILTRYGVIVAVAVGLIIYFVRQWLQSDAGRRRWEAFVLQLPVFGPLAARFAMTRFCRMLGTLLQAGVPLITALRVARESIGNKTLDDAVAESTERVKQGDALAASLADCKQLFPGTVIEMIAVAEESGRLDEELIRLANTTERDLDSQLRLAVSLSEPLLLFLIAGFIGTIFIGMVLPIFTIQDLIQQ